MLLSDTTSTCIYTATTLTDLNFKKKKSKIDVHYSFLIIQSNVRLHVNASNSDV